MYEITIQIYEKDTVNQLYRGTTTGFESAAELLGKAERFCKRIEAAKAQEESDKELPL